MLSGTLPDTPCIHSGRRSHPLKEEMVLTTMELVADDEDEDEEQETLIGADFGTSQSNVHVLLCH